MGFPDGADIGLTGMLDVQLLFLLLTLQRFGWIQVNEHPAIPLSAAIESTRRNTLLSSYEPELNLPFRPKSDQCQISSTFALVVFGDRGFGPCDAQLAFRKPLRQRADGWYESKRGCSPGAS